MKRDDAASAEKLQPLAGGARAASRSGGPRWLQDLRDARRRAVHRARVPDGARRGVAVHERRADRGAEFAPADADPSGAAERLERLPLRDAPHRLVFVNGRFAPALSRRRACRPASRPARSAAALNGTDPDVVQRYFGQLADFDDARVRRAEHRLRRTAPSSRSRRRRPRGAAPIAVRRRGADARDGDVAPADADRRRRAQPGADRRDLRRRAGRDLLHQRRHRGVRRRERGARSLQGPGGERRGVPHRQHARARVAQRATSRRTRSRSAASWCATTPSPCSTAKARECTLNGLYLADGDRLVDNHTTIDHAKPHCPSHEIYKGILGGKARAVFNGKIIVRQDAQKTDAKQTNRALLLSDDATDQHQAAARDLRRRREVHARRGDRPARRGRDVLPARPRPDLAEARDMLIHAFAGEILDRVQIEPLRVALEVRALRSAGEGSRRGGRA